MITSISNVALTEVTIPATTDFPAFKEPRLTWIECERGGEKRHCECDTRKAFRFAYNILSAVRRPTAPMSEEDRRFLLALVDSKSTVPRSAATALAAEADRVLLELLKPLTPKPEGQ